MIEIKEYIDFGRFNSKKEGFYIVEREAPTPSEKLITENLNYANGVLDFSNITGERFYEQRTITYQIMMVGVEYEQRKQYENRCKRLLMSPYDQRLYDTHDRGYYWVGKCKSVKVDDNQEKRQLTFNIEFSLYPFAIKNNADSSIYDDWDTFDFENDFIQPFSYRVTDEKEVMLVNIGENSVSPTVVTSDKIVIIKDGGRFEFSPKKPTDYLFNLGKGISKLMIKGNATVRFVIKSEVLL